jgi:7-cyano-7-deazaguanine synthase in queuosine biosynthesis
MKHIVGFSGGIDSQAALRFVRKGGLAVRAESFWQRQCHRMEHYLTQRRKEIDRKYDYRIHAVPCR